MGLFRRRRETLNERLLRDAGIEPVQALVDTTEAEPLLEPPPGPLGAVFGGDGLPHRLAVGPKEWDAAVTVTAPGLAGDEIRFTTIPDGDLIVSEESGDADLSPLADAVERRVDPPYRAVATRQGNDLWAVGAKRIAVAQIPFPAGDKLELSWNGDDTELRVDGEPSDAPVPSELAELGQAAGTSYYVEAARIDGDLWEVRVAGL